MRVCPGTCDPVREWPDICGPVRVWPDTCDPVRVWPDICGARTATHLQPGARMSNGCTRTFALSEPHDVDRSHIAPLHARFDRGWGPEWNDDGPEPRQSPTRPIEW
jgi:hypothetical protein